MRGPRGYLELLKLIIKSSKQHKHKVTSVEDLIVRHFETWSTLDHQNRYAFVATLQNSNGQPKTIIETGTSAWGTDSTRLWDSYVRNFGGIFYSVDIRHEASDRLKWQMGTNTHLIVDDSVRFLRSSKTIFADIYFLDSWDLDLDDPEPSAFHGLREFQEIRENLRPGTVLLIDDTPILEVLSQNGLTLGCRDFLNKYQLVPGKGAFIKQILDAEIAHEVLHHQYSLVVRIV